MAGQSQAQLTVRTEVEVDERRNRRRRLLADEIETAQNLPRDIFPRYPQSSLTRDVVVRRWALYEQLTEDADRAGRQLELARHHWLAVAHCCRAFREEVIGRHHG
jgi:hypothetical protein